MSTKASQFTGISITCSNGLFGLTEQKSTNLCGYINLCGEHIVTSTIPHKEPVMPKGFSMTSHHNGCALLLFVAYCLSNDLVLNHISLYLNLVSSQTTPHELTCENIWWVNCYMCLYKYDVCIILQGLGMSWIRLQGVGGGVSRQYITSSLVYRLAPARDRP